MTSAAAILRAVNRSIAITPYLREIYGPRLRSGLSVSCTSPDSDHGAIRSFVIQGVGHHRPLEAFAARLRQHLRRKIHAGNFRLRQPACEGEGQIAAARREVEETRGTPAFDDGSRAAAPPKIDPAAEQMIRQVVAPRDAVKHPAHGCWFT